MGAPTVVHEERAALLADLATLSGYTVEVAAWASIRPDVVRLHMALSSLLIGDAKSTETPRDAGTRGRLRAYAEASREWLAAGFAVDLVIVHGPENAHRWLACLQGVAALTGLRCSTVHCRPLGWSDWVSGVSLGLTSGRFDRDSPG